MSTAGKSTRAGRGGFTLFELLIVIAILAVVTGLVAPHLDLSVGETGVDGAVRRIQASINEGRTWAQLHRQDVEVRFGPAHMKAGPEGKERAYPDGVVFRELELAGDAGESKNTLQINRRGITSTAILRFEMDGRVYSLLVNPVVRTIEYGEGTKDFGDFAD